jgi:flotillin
MIADKVRSTSADDMNKMGLEVISFTIKEVRDENEYITNMGRPDVARIRRDAEVAAAEANRDIAIRQADTQREAAVARAAADQERVIAETASKTRQAEAQRDLDVKSAEYEASVKKTKAQADRAYDIETNIQEQQVVAEKVRIDRVQREEQIKVQEAEIKRRELELMATVQKAAEAERAKILALAEAERQRLSLEATGRAEAIRQQGMAEAEIIKAKGEAEAEAMRVKADAFQQYNQAAVLDKVLTGLPEVVRAMAEPLTKVDKITVVSTGGNGSHGAGVNQITADVAQMIAQVPALLETLTGMKVGDLMQQVPQLRQGGESTNGSNGTVKKGVED